MGYHLEVGRTVPGASRRPISLANWRSIQLLRKPGQLTGCRDSWSSASKWHGINPPSVGDGKGVAAPASPAPHITATSQAVTHKRR